MGLGEGPGGLPRAVLLARPVPRHAHDDTGWGRGSGAPPFHEPLAMHDHADQPVLDRDTPALPAASPLRAQAIRQRAFHARLLPPHRRRARRLGPVPGGVIRRLIICFVGHPLGRLGPDTVQAPQRVWAIHGRGVGTALVARLACVLGWSRQLAAWSHKASRFSAPISCSLFSWCITRLDALG